MNELLLEIALIFLLLVANGVFAMSEIAVVSARKARLQQLAESGDQRARTALELATDPNRFLSTVQIGITLVGILAGVLGGATLAGYISLGLNTIAWLAPYREVLSLGIVVIVIAYFSLVIGELVPKRLGLDSAERIASAVAGPMKMLSTFTAPIVHLLDRSADLVIRLMGVKPSTEPTITPEEIKVLVEQGTESGVFERSEQAMIESVLQLDQMRVGMFMTPRTQMVWFNLEDSPAEIQRKIVESQRSRFPVAKDHPDNIVGIVRVKDLLARLLDGHSLDLKAVLRPPLFIPENMSALKVLELFKQKITHIALVTDEYGSIQGLITHNDILEAIIGDLPSMDDKSEPRIVHRDDDSWLVDGLLTISKLKDTLDIEQLPGETSEGYHTVAGFIISQFRHIPTTGQHFEWRQWRFEVVDMDGRRVDKILVTPLKNGG